MSNTRSVAMKFGECISAMQFADAFSLVADDGTCTVIGTTKVSGVFHGSKDLWVNSCRCSAGSWNLGK